MLLRLQQANHPCAHATAAPEVEWTKLFISGPVHTKTYKDALIINTVQVSI